MSCLLRKMLRHELGHFKHIDHALPSKHRLQRRVGVDIAFIFRVLEIMALDVYPELFYDLRPWHRTFPNDCGKLGTYVQWLHERRISIRHISALLFGLL